MNYTGTNIFLTSDDANKYYEEQLDLTPNEVYRKVIDGEIVISRKTPSDWNGYWSKEGRFIKEEK
jgi:hypothetical protein